MSVLSKTNISGYIYEIIGYENNVAEFKLNLIKSKGIVYIVAPTDKIYLGAYIDAVGSWSEKNHKMKFIASKIQMVIPKNVNILSSTNYQYIGEALEAITVSPKELLEQAIMEDILIFCKHHKIPARYASNIYKTYGDNTMQNLLDNPYRLAFDLRIISFEHAEKIAMKLGMYKHLSAARIEAGIKYVLYDEALRGDVSVSSIIKKISSLLNIREEIATKAFEKAVREKVVTIS